MPTIVPQGNLNRLLASITFVSLPALNITPSYLGKEMISLNFEGVATTPFETATGVVYSPEPYQRATVMAHLVKTMGLAAAWQQQEQLSTLLGDVVVWPDENPAIGIGPYQLSNCSFTNVNPQRYDGLDPNWTISISGIYYINSQLWNA